MFVSVTIFHHSNYTKNYRVKKKCTNLLLLEVFLFLSMEDGGGRSTRGVISGVEMWDTERNEKPRN